MIQVGIPPSILEGYPAVDLPSTVGRTVVSDTGRTDVSDTGRTVVSDTGSNYRTTGIVWCMQDNWDSVVYVYDRTQAQNRLLLPVAALKFPLGPQTAPREEETGSVTKTATPRQARMVMTAHIDLRGNRVVARSVLADAAHDSFNTRSSQSRSHFTQ